MKPGLALLNRLGLLAALRTCLSLWMALLTSASFAAGTVDAQFNAPTGWLAFPIDGSAINEARAMVVQPNGRIVLAGSCHNGSNTDFCVARVHFHGGGLDTTFTGPSGIADGRFMLPIGSGNDVASTIALQADGKIVLGGSCFGAGFNNFCLARLNVDGSLDTSFNGPDASGNGVGTGQGRFMIRVAASGNELIASIAIQSDGKLVVAGHCRPETRTALCVARLNPDGSFDSAFDGPDANGTGAGTGNGRFFRYIGGGDATASQVAVQNDGRILVVGTCTNAGTAQDFCAVSLMPMDGRLNTGFATTGIVQLPMSSGAGPDFATSLAFTHRGEILIAGSCFTGSNYEFCLVKLLPSGQNSLFTWPGSTRMFRSVGSGDDYATGLAVQPDGKIVISGLCQSGAVYQFCAARYSAEGNIDQLFHGTSIPAHPTGGSVMVPSMLSDDQANALAVQVTMGNFDGYRMGLLLAGSCRFGTVTHFCVTRLGPDYPVVPMCSPDVDGDGRMLATVDGLILTRIMLGLRDDKVIQGINFPTGSVRHTWGDIQQYLTQQCGMSLPPDLASQ